jgi:hypothetical protein
VRGSAGASAAKTLTENGLKTVIVGKAKLWRYTMYGGIHIPTSITFVADHCGQIPDTVISTPREIIGTPVYSAIEGNVAEFSVCIFITP